MDGLDDLTNHLAQEASINFYEGPGSDYTHQFNEIQKAIKQNCGKMEKIDWRVQNFEAMFENICPTRALLSLMTRAEAQKEGGRGGARPPPWHPKMVWRPPPWQTRRPPKIRNVRTL